MGKTATTRWLKRIFSLEFLGVIIAAVSLWYTYQQFIAEKSGDLEWANYYGNVSKKTNYIIVSLPYTGDSIQLNTNTMPMLSSSKSQVEDLIVMAEIPVKAQMRIHPAYNVNTEKQEHYHDKLTAVFETARLGAHHSVPFPIQTIYPEDGETIKIPVTLSYVYKNCQENVNGTTFDLVVYPNNGDMTEKEFMSAIKPLLLSADESGKLGETSVLLEDRIIKDLDIDKIKSSTTWKLEDWH